MAQISRLYPAGKSLLNHASLLLVRLLTYEAMRTPWSVRRHQTSSRLLPLDIPEAILSTAMPTTMPMRVVAVSCTMPWMSTA